MTKFIFTVVGVLLAAAECLAEPAKPLVALNRASEEQVLKHFSSFETCLLVEVLGGGTPTFPYASYAVLKIYRGQVTKAELEIRIPGPSPIGSTLVVFRREVMATNGNVAHSEEVVDAYPITKGYIQYAKDITNGKTLTLTLEQWETIVAKCPPK